VQLRESQRNGKIQNGVEIKIMPWQLSVNGSEARRKRRRQRQKDITPFAAQ
jgi:hypothetical protein